MVPTFMFVSFCLLVMPALPRDRNWSRTLITAIVFFVTARYMVWRIGETVLPADLSMSRFPALFQIRFQVSLCRLPAAKQEADRDIEQSRMK